MPQPEHLDNPAAFIDGLLDESGDQEFEAEFAKLEEMLRSEGNGEAGGEGGSENTGTDADSHDSGDSDDER